MGKLLLFVALGVVVWWLWRKSQRQGASVSPPMRPAELMVACSYCGVNQPRSECVESGGRLYCSEKHRQAAEREIADG